MALYYLDSSALVKRYVLETGSSWIETLVTEEAGHLTVTSKITVVEVVSAFARRLRENTISEQEYRESLQAFHQDCLVQYHLVEVNNTVLDWATKLVERHPLRAYDAVQLSTGIIVNRLFIELDLPPLIFLSADDRLVAAAPGEGLLADNPNLHP